MIFISLIKDPCLSTNYFNNKLKWFIIFTIGNLIVNIPFVHVLEFGEAEELEDFINNLNILEQFGLLAILPAIFEEFVFRYPLCQRRIGVDIIFLCAIPFSLFLIFNFSNMGFYLGVFAWILYVFFRKSIRLKLSKRKYSTPIFYMMSLLFALIHLGNYSGDPLITSVTLVFLAFVSAIFFGLIRIHIGFRYAVMSHFFYNAVLLTLSHVAP